MLSGNGDASVYVLQYYVCVCLSYMHTHTYTHTNIHMHTFKMFESPSCLSTCVDLDLQRVSSSNTSSIPLLVTEVGVPTCTAPQLA